MSPSAKRLAFRFLARAQPSRAFREGLAAIRKQDAAPLQTAIKEIFAFLGIEFYSSGDFGGSSVRITAPWYDSLGVRNQGRVKETFHGLRQLQRTLGSAATYPSDWTRAAEAAEKLVPEVLWLEQQARGDEDGIQHGNVLFIPMAGISKPALAACIEAYDAAAGFLQKKFPEVLYGKIFVSKTLPKSHTGAVAQYIEDNDTIGLSLKAKAHGMDVHAICHEFGHRYHRKFWKDRAAFQRLYNLTNDPVYETIEFDSKLKGQLADELIAGGIREYRAGRPAAKPSPLLSQYLNPILRGPLLRDFQRLSQAAVKGGAKEEAEFKAALIQEGPDRIRTDKVLREPITLTPYVTGLREPLRRANENFAEAFAFYVMGKPLPPEIQEIVGHLK